MALPTCLTLVSRPGEEHPQGTGILTQPLIIYLSQGVKVIPVSAQVGTRPLAGLKRKRLSHRINISGGPKCYGGPLRSVTYSDFLF